MTVDTLSLAKELRESELSPTQAEAIAAAIGRAVLEASATKADIQLVRGEITSGKHELRGEIEAVRGEIEKLRSSMLTYFIATIISLAGVIVAVVKL